MKKGYESGIPDVAPKVLENKFLAPSYRLICLAILKNDHSLKTLGQNAIKSEAYYKLKDKEFETKRKQVNLIIGKE